MLTLQTEQLAKVTLAPRAVCVGTERGSSYRSAFGGPHDARRSRMCWRMRPTAADGGLTALRELEHAAAMGTPFPLVLLDAQMPDMDGFALAQRIKDTPELCGATIMMLSSSGLPSDAARCRVLRRFDIRG